MEKESRLMKFFRKLKLDPIAWSLRRLYCPVNKTDLVLEIGSGGNPFFRSNVLCDAFSEETSHRQFAKLKHDRPTVLAFGENLPFKDKTFDFVIACHVLEHSDDPEKFLSELQRVAKAGYIEVPDAFVERLTTYSVHRLEITERDNGLVIRKKRGIMEDADVSQLFRHQAWLVFNKWFSQNPFHFHVRYYWNQDDEGIKYQIVNPDYQFDWDLVQREKIDSKLNYLGVIKKLILSTVSLLLSQTQRNKNIDVLTLMKCQVCQVGELSKQGADVVCSSCQKHYSTDGNIINTIV